MADLGLPLSFGKQTLPVRPDGLSSATTSASASAGAPPPRGGPAGRGPRGVVGGGKKARGRGRGGAAGGGGDSVSASMGEEFPSFNSGVKRPHNPTNPNFLQPQSLQSNHNHNHQSQTPPRGSFGGGRGGPSNRGGPGGPGGPGGGGRGRGGSHSGGGARSHGASHGEIGSEAGQKGFYKPSFVEDPWAELMEKRERRLAGRG